MTMTNQTSASIGKLQIRAVCQKGLDLEVHSLGQEPTGAGAQHLCQRIVDLVGLTKPHDVAILFHGVSLSPRGSGRLGHPPRYAAFLTPLSPTFPHSS